MGSNITSLGKHLCARFHCSQNPSILCRPLQSCVLSQVENCFLAKTKICLHRTDFIFLPQVRRVLKHVWTACTRLKGRKKKEFLFHISLSSIFHDFFSCHKMHFPRWLTMGMSTSFRRGSTLCPQGMTLLCGLTWLTISEYVCPTKE